MISDGKPYCGKDTAQAPVVAALPSWPPLLYPSRHLGAYTMPSDDAATDLLNGKSGGVGEVLACWALRALVIAPALAVAGVDSKKIVRASLLTSGAITMLGLGYLVLKHRL